MTSKSPPPPAAPITTAWTVNDVLRVHPATAAVFNQFGVDTCCSGAASLTEAAHEVQLDPRALVAALEAELESVDRGARPPEGVA